MLHVHRYNEYLIRRLKQCVWSFASFSQGQGIYSVEEAPEQQVPLYNWFAVWENEPYNF